MGGKWFSIMAFAAALAGPATSIHGAPPTHATTIILVHGAFAESSSWNPVISILKADGYSVIAAANPLRGLKTDAGYINRIARSVDGPVVLVGHSYGGEVISVAAQDSENVKALVFVAGLAPDSGESASSLGQRFPTGTLGSALAPPIAQAGGGHDLYIDQAKYWQQFAADSPKAAATQMAATQRPITEAALAEGAEGQPGWKRLPSFFIYGSLDRNIPSNLHAFMARRANAKEVIAIDGASHALMLSNPAKVASLIERAASAK